MKGLRYYKDMGPTRVIATLPDQWIVMHLLNRLFHRLDGWRLYPEETKK